MFNTIRAYSNIGLVPLLSAIFFAAGLARCGARPGAEPEAPVFVATIAPVAALLQPVVDEALHPIVPAGASPHTYDLRPADARRAADAKAVFFVDPAVDGWAARLPAPERVELFALVPEAFRLTYADVSVDGGAALNPHFWMDPLAVRALAPVLADRLAELQPDRASEYRSNAKAFANDLQNLHEDIKETLAPAKGKAVIQFHPSMDYFLHRYGIRVAGVVEPSPGQEPTPKDLKELIDRARAERVRVIVTEPQLPDAPTRALAEATGATIVELDPLGGVPGRATYRELLLFNARALVEASE